MSTNCVSAWAIGSISKRAELSPSDAMETAIAVPVLPFEQCAGAQLIFEIDDRFGLFELGNIQNQKWCGGYGRAQRDGART
jgi:hypothetical protein